MAKQLLKSPRARLFVALDLPDRVREGIGRWQAKALADPAKSPPQNGQNCPSGQGCPGGPALSESPHPITLLLVGLALVTVCLCVVALRQRARRLAT